MATWEYHIYILEKKEFLEVFGNVTRIEDILDDDNYWKNGNERYKEFSTYLSSILSKFEFWTDEIGFWGSKEKSKLEVGFNNNDIDGIHLRLDLRDIEFIDFLKNILVFVEKFNLVMFDLKGDLLNPELRKIFDKIKESNPYKFVTNPHEFLENLPNFDK